jgi:hypothetical protein
MAAPSLLSFTMKPVPEPSGKISVCSARLSGKSGELVAPAM